MVWHPEKVGEPAPALGVSECFPVALRCGVHVLVRAPSLFRCWPCVLLPRCLPRPLFGAGLGRATAWRLCSVHCYWRCELLRLPLDKLLAARLVRHLLLLPLLFLRSSESVSNAVALEHLGIKSKFCLCRPQ